MIKYYNRYCNNLIYIIHNKIKNNIEMGNQ